MKQFSEMAKEIIDREFPQHPEWKLNETSFHITKLGLISLISEAMQAAHDAQEFRIELRDKKIKELNEQRELMREALEYYADRSNWLSSGKGLAISWFDLISDDTEASPHNDRQQISGRRAREALALSEGE